MTRRSFWTNTSALALGGDRDPMETIVERARDVALEAIESGWSGPPFNPFELAERLGVTVVAREELADARLVTDEEGQPLLEYNPTRPRGRLRFSIAHELAHTFFADFATAPRYRSATKPASDAWQLELLCDVAAAELLMPVGSFAELEDEPLKIERLMELRRDYDVSTEALLLRVIKLSPTAGAAFAASRVDGSNPESELRIDYVVPSRAGWTGGWRVGLRLPATSTLGQCTAIGYTAKGTEEPNPQAAVSVECVGVPPYPGDRLPRVVGLVVPCESVAEATEFIEVYGDATTPRGTGRKVIAHIVNDRTPNWGGAFARQLRGLYPDCQTDFRDWVADDRAHLRIGEVRFCDVAPELTIASMVAQRGYGESHKPRVRYAALAHCLDEVAKVALDAGASVHMPRIGTGGGGGDWRLIRELISDAFDFRRIPVIVYGPPETKPAEPAQQVLQLG